MATHVSVTPQRTGSPVGPEHSQSSLPAHTAAHMCEESVERMQLVAELLLLQSGRDKPAALEPVMAGNESYGKSRDAIVANTKGLAISIKEFSKRLHKKEMMGVYRLAQKVADQVITLIEAAAHAAYLAALNSGDCQPASPSLLDRYTFSRARQELRLAYDKFRLEHGPLSREQIMQISSTFADNLAELTHGCKLAAENRRIKISDRVQLSHCAQGLQGTTAAFLTSLKAFASSDSSEDRRKCVLFGKPLLETVHCVVEYAHFPQFAGQPAKLSEEGYQAQTEILAGAMAIVGACVQLLNTGQSLLESKKTVVGGEAEQWQKLVNCTKAVADATRFLSSAIHIHTPLPSLSSSRCASLEDFGN